MSFFRADPAGKSQLAMTVWLFLAIVAIAASTVFAAGLVLARTPAIGALLSLQHAFPALLVMHVDFAAGIWFFAMAAAIWSMALAPSRSAGVWKAGLLAGAGICAMVLTPLWGPLAKPILSDYLPVLEHPIYLGGAAMFLAGWGWVAFWVMTARSKDFASVMPVASHPALWWAAWVGMAAILVLVRGLLLTPAQAWRDHYAVLVWGPGHLLQLMHLLVALAAWIGLAHLSGAHSSTYRPLRFLPATIAAPALAYGGLAPWLDGSAETASSWGYTLLMSWGGTVSLGAVWVLLRRTAESPGNGGHYRVVLRYSLLLYATGIALGFLIRENNTVVPAHYHGAIGGVTLAFMGIAYHLMEHLGFSLPSPRGVKAQSRVYALGMLMMIAGLVLAAMPRKSPMLPLGATGWIDQLGFALMALGGVTSLVGSLAFLCVLLWPMRHGSATAEPRLIAPEGEVT